MKVFNYFFGMKVYLRSGSIVVVSKKTGKQLIDEVFNNSNLTNKYTTCRETHAYTCENTGFWLYDSIEAIK